MIGMRMSGAVLAVGMAVAVIAGTPTPQHPADRVAVAAVTWQEPPEETVTVLLEQALPNVPGKTFTSAIVDFPPGSRAVPHRHGQAFVYAYVLDGTVRSQIEGQPVQTYHAGQNWVEEPGAHHVLTENTSSTEPAKLLVVFISNTGDPIRVPD
ncbi:cupin domain-containing protein [Catellatospora sichuanensis]|uniref:cupin domain-containing protein n=1 Tax=Catellatospora sichuanensis TaxID=1969805 RepID=UPI001183CF0C|nr:cupin domain-containing protein [Catellatospora sichuanensis]